MHVLGSGSLSGCFTSTKGTVGAGSQGRGQEDLLKSASQLCDRLLHEVFRKCNPTPS